MAVQVTITWRRIVAAILLPIVLALAGYGAYELATPEKTSLAVDKDRFQAVVLSSGVVYFGHLREKNDAFYELRDAYFIQEVKVAGKEPTRRVLPLKEEIHGPDNGMLIPRGQVVSIENLRTDSPVAKAAESGS